MPESFTVLLGVHDRIKEFNNHVKSYSVQKIIVHEGFETLKHHILINDIALLQVNEITYGRYIQPICLPFNFGKYFKLYKIKDFKHSNSTLKNVRALTLIYIQV